MLLQKKLRQQPHISAEPFTFSSCGCGFHNCAPRWVEFIACARILRQHYATNKCSPQVTPRWNDYPSHPPPPSRVKHTIRHNRGTNRGTNKTCQTHPL